MQHGLSSLDSHYAFPSKNLRKSLVCVVLSTHLLLKSVFLLHMLMVNLLTSTSSLGAN